MAKINYEFDPDKVYFFGISEGGYGSQRLASYYADYLARILFVLGGKNVPEYCRRSRKIWYFRKKCLSCQRKASENSDVFKARTRNCNDIRQLKKDRLSGKKSTLSN